MTDLVPKVREFPQMKAFAGRVDLDDLVLIKAK